MTDSDKVTLRDVYNLVSDLRDEIKAGFVTKEEFNPVKKVVYGMVRYGLGSIAGLILLVGILTSLVIAGR